MRHQILFLAANPIGITVRKIDEDAREIEQEIQFGVERDRFQFVPLLAAQPMDLLRALRRTKPSIVHFVGHAQTGGIYLTDNESRPIRIARETLLATFGAAGQSVRVIVLDGCATEDLTRALCDFVPVCVGTSPPINAAAARAFCLGFYGALASGEPTGRACAQGRAAMLLTATGDHEPILYHRSDVDPGTLVLAEGLSRLSHAAELAVVIRRYRTRKSGAFERWDLRAVGPPVVGRRPTVTALDDVYIPLRFAQDFDSGIYDRGTPITQNDILRPRRHQVIIGAAGSGKTTWMRWTFRRLLENSGAIPFFLELRTIASAWKTPKDAAVTIESYLAEELEECGATRPIDVVAAVLADTSGPRPVILIDGWDEIGDHGELLRKRLVELCRVFPHVIVIVSSRPYGQTRPASAEAFETVYIQPLSDHDVRMVAHQFYRRVYHHNELDTIRNTNEFIIALAAAHNARSLAENVLLLLMMLFLSQKGPLPDRRHKLYGACLHNMLFERVALRERDGVVVDCEQQWRPEDRDERVRAVAELAYRMQNADDRQHRRGPVTCDWTIAVDSFRNDWSHDKRERFLRWLLESTGVLIDRTDGSVQFAHQSFQEYLVAYYLLDNYRHENYIDVVYSRMNDFGQWEILRLLVALIDDCEPGKLGPVFDVLRAGIHAYWLAGQMLADGIGRQIDFEAWAAELPLHLSNPFSSGEGYAWAWAVSKQNARRDRLATILEYEHRGLHWLNAAWNSRWSSRANLKISPAPALLALPTPLDSPTAVARSRLLHGAMAGWPDGSELAMLRLWPSTRAVVNVRLQTAISLGANVRDIQEILLGMLVLIERSQKSAPMGTREIARKFAEHLRDAFAGHSGANFTRDSSAHFSRDFARDLARCFVRDFGLAFSRGTGEKLVTEFGRNFGTTFWGTHLGVDYLSTSNRRLPEWHYLGNFAQLSHYDMRSELVGDLSPSDALAGTPWQSTFLAIEVRAVAGRAAPRATLAHGRLFGNVALLVLFQAACRASFAANNKRLRIAVTNLCDAFDGDPIWPALARHIARMSTTMDRSLLEDLARHPQRRASPLSWGIQHYVRGDLTLDDGSVITLDELCAMAGLAPLPLLEDMPDELDI